MSHLPHARVLASAGTGKTHRLSSRYLDLILRGADPRTLLATTFTRAAAAEIRERVLVRAAKGLLENRARAQLASELNRALLPSDDLERVLGSLLHHLSELQICTIDSFVARLTTVGSQELGLGTTPELVYDDRERGLQSRILRRIFDRLDSEQALDAFAVSIDGLSKGSPAQSISNTLQEIVGFGLPPFHETNGRIAPWLWASEEGLDALDLSPISEGLRKAVDGHSKTITKAVAKLCGILDSLAPESDRFTVLKETRATTLCLKVRNGESTYGRGKDNLIDEPLRVAIQQLNDYVDRLVVEEYGRRTRSTHALLAEYHEAREEVRREQGVASFQDLVRVLVEADPELLRDELWFRLDGRIDHLLLDEFQDTSLMQWKVLRPLAEEIVSDGTGERTFFSVGDVKQSIYGWRGGLPEILEHLPTLILQDGVRAAIDDENLYRSWRTGPEILGVINQVFSTIDQRPMMKDAEHLALAADRFRRIWVEHESAPGRPSGCFELISSPLDPEDRASAVEQRSAAADRAADLAAELHRAHPGLTVGVLTPQNKVASQVLALLRRQGLDATGEGGGNFLDCGASIVFLDALRLASHPGDSAAAFNLRSSPLKAALELADDGPSDSELARSLRWSFASQGIARTFECWFNRLSGQLDQREITRLERLIAETERMEAGGLSDLVMIRRELEGLRLDEPGSDGIRVMTIHGSKGLAFDLVVLTGIDGPLIRPGKLVHERDPLSLELRRLSRWVNKNLLPPEIEPLQTFTQADMAFERFCQLYVAMTRVRQGLFVVVAPPGTKNVSKTSMGTLLSQSFAPEQRAEDPRRPELLVSVGSRECLSTEGILTQTAAESSSICIRLQGTPLDPLPGYSPSRMVKKAAGRDTMPPVDGQEARRYGSAIHSLFELIEFIEDPLPSEERLRSQLHRFCPRNDPDWQDRVLADFHGMLEHPEVRSVLSREDLLRTAPSAEALRVWRESGWLQLTDEGLLATGIFDRVVVFERAGVPVGGIVVDWKTDRVDSASAERHALRYQAQLDA
ncbi:MAG: UvrD-helicase domain-containing protein [Planctomycetota bacterium]|nr:UvrD-helicase domain-containing protein [Planctomycetota bacterium]